MRADLMTYVADGKDVLAIDVASGRSAVIATAITPNLAKILADMLNSVAEHNRQRNWVAPEFEIQEEQQP